MDYLNFKKMIASYKTQEEDLKVGHYLNDNDLFQNMILMTYKNEIKTPLDREYFKLFSEILKSALQMRGIAGDFGLLNNDPTFRTVFESKKSFLISKKNFNEEDIEKRFKEIAEILHMTGKAECIELKANVKLFKLFWQPVYIKYNVISTNKGPENALYNIEEDLLRREKNKIVSGLMVSTNKKIKTL